MVVGGSSDIAQTFLSNMTNIYQSYLSICMYGFCNPVRCGLTIILLVASRALLVPTDNGTEIIGNSNVPMSYLFLSATSVHLLSGVLLCLALLSMLVAYQQRRKHHQYGFSRKVAAIAGSPFTIAGAVSMVIGQPWAEEAIAPPQAEMPANSQSRSLPADKESGRVRSTMMNQEIEGRLAQSTYALDWSGKIVKEL